MLPASGMRIHCHGRIRSNRSRSPTNGRGCVSRSKFGRRVSSGNPARRLSIGSLIDGFAVAADSDDVYQMDDVRFLPGNPDDVETARPATRGSRQSRKPAAIPNVREGLPKSDRLFGLRGGVNVTNIREGSGQQWLAASGNVFTSSSIVHVGCRALRIFPLNSATPAVNNDSLPAGDPVFHGNVHYFHRNDALNAKNFFDPANAPIPPFKYHFFGANAGGMIRDGTYFYSRVLGPSDPSIDHARGHGAGSSPAHRRFFIDCRNPILDPDTGFPFPGKPHSRRAGSTRQGLALARACIRRLTCSTDHRCRTIAQSGELETAADAFGFRLDHR